MLVSHNALLGVDGGKALSVVAAFEIERFVVRTVDRGSLTCPQADTEASRGGGLHIISLPDHRLDMAVTVAGNKEGDHPLTANRGDYRFVRTDRT